MKFNIIGNGCFSTFLTKDYLNHEYVNPFIWSLIEYEDMFNLIKNYDNINFNNFTVNYNKQDNNYFIILDDYHIKIIYLHYKYDKNAKKYTIIGNDGFYCDMENFLKNRWLSHIEKMKTLKPIFCIAQTNPNNIYTDEQLQNIKNINTSYDIIIINERMGNTEAARKIFNEFLKPKYIMTEEELKQKLIADFTKRGYNFDIDHPKTIQEKIQWMKLHDSTPLKTKCADKILVHEYCKEKLGKDICTPILKVYNNVNEINLSELPSQFVIKCNHGCHYNIIVKDKSTFDLQEAKTKLNTWLGRDFAFWYGCEMHYSPIKRKVFVEKYMNDGHDDLIDYKFLCFNGVPTYCQIISDRGNKELKRLNYYDMDFNFVDICRLEFPNNPNLLDKKPKNFELMKEYAKVLSKDFKFVRVDFYEIGDEVYLGELTFTPGSGYIKYKNPDHGLMLGNKIQM